MRLQRIYSSKLYVTSIRKDRIHAAIQDHINAELIQQVAEYLDEDSKVLLEQAEQQEIQKESADAEPTENTSTETSSPASSAPSGGGGHSSFSGSVIDDFGEPEFTDEDFSADETAESPAPDTSDDEVIESVNKEGKPITATSVIWTTLDDVVSDIDTIQGTLNSREDTKGVIRLQVVDNELWIYFNDDVNLNDKMVDVIELLNATGYTYLKFNRLARSNNAIVFDIGLTVEPMKPESELDT